MREYIHFFEDSSQRDAYENGSDYIEPYVSYTPVIIDEYEAQFNGETVNMFKVEKIQGGYKVEYYELDELVTEEEVLTNSDSFYFSPAFIFPEDLNLTEESTEFIFNGDTYYLVYDTDNKWSVYTDSEHTQLSDWIRKLDIVSVPSSSNDFVHYNKVTPERIITKFIVVDDYAAKGLATLSRKVAGDSRLFEQIYINGTPILNQLAEENPRKLSDYSVYHTFEEEGTYDIEYILKEGYVGTIPEFVFPAYQYFSEIIIPKGVTTIKTGAFSFISNYPYTNPEINVIIPNTITLVEDNAVYCSSLNSSTVQKFISINPNSVYTSACEK